MQPRHRPAVPGTRSVPTGSPIRSLRARTPRRAAHSRARPRWLR